MTSLLAESYSLDTKVHNEIKRTTTSQTSSAQKTRPRSDSDYQLEISNLKREMMYNIFRVFN
jgi:hypothetical protein